MDLKLKDRVAFLTGATNEIGWEVCHSLVREGVKLHFSDVNVEKGEALSKDLADLGGEAFFSKVDVRDYDHVKKSVEHTVDRFGRIDIMVYMAGLGHPKRFVETTPDDWKASMDVLLLGMMNTTHAVLPHMIENQYGKIVSMIGESSRIGESGLSMIAAPRAGQPALVKSVAREVGRYNITLNCVAVGIVDTSHYPSGHIDKYRDKIVKNYPTGRLGVPEDVAPMVTFLCSELSGWITGQVIGVNGGYTMI
ncbi:MAG: SDR family oxidoreductase [Desulfobacteraceae bacterium]|jgi:NAD(P)-dependent dehydrogenase (short-subunit alcohol dehydrogenase family)